LIGKRGPLLRSLLPHLLLLLGVYFPFLLPPFSRISQKVFFSVSFGIAASSCNTDVYFLFHRRGVDTEFLILYDRWNELP
jgi:hypothetical protein